MTMGANLDGVATRRDQDGATTVTDVVVLGMDFIYTYNSIGNFMYPKGLFANFSARAIFRKYRV